MKRVAILGAESSGKSTLAAALAARYDTVWVPEYLREFVEVHQRVPCAADQFLIASIQLERERAAEPGANGMLFCDPTPLMTVIYSRYYFGAPDARLAALADNLHYDATFVTAPDTPWEADGLQRESESVRQIIHQMLLDELAARKIAYTMVTGNLEQRLLQAAARLGLEAA